MEIDAGERPGVPSSVEARIKELERENAELRRANEIQDGVGVFRSGGARPQTAVIVGYIDRFRDRFGVEPICRVLTEHDVPIAPSTYYAHKATPVSQADWDDAHMANTALEVWRANRSLYGADKLATAMGKAGHDVGRDQVARLMGIVGIEGARRGKHRTVTTRRDPQGARAPDLVRRRWRTPTRPDQWWVADFNRLLGEGADVAAVARHLEVSEQTYHRWRNQFGGMKADDAKRLREFERENSRLKRIVADKELEIDALREIARGNF